MKTKHILLIGSVGIGLAGLAYALSKPQQPSLIEENTAASNNAIANGKPPVSVSSDVKLIQDFLNRVINNASPLVVDGISGPATIARIKQFQQLVGRGNPVTGTWGKITEANALAVYGFTPFQGPKTKLEPVKATLPNNNQLVEQGRLKALLLNKFAYPNKTSLRLLENPKLTSAIAQTVTRFTQNAIGQITEVAFDFVGGRMYTFVRLKWATTDKKWALLTDVDVYTGASGKLFSSKVNI